MKKSTGAILIIIIVLLLGVVGAGGYFLIKGNNDSNKQIGELKNEVANLGKSNENINSNQVSNTEKNETVSQNTSTTTSTQNTTNTTTQSVRTMKDVAGIYRCTISDVCHVSLALSEEGTFSYGGEVGEKIGNYYINGDTIVLNTLFRCGSDVSIRSDRGQHELKIKDKNLIETDNKDNYLSDNISQIISLKREESNTNNYDIRLDIKNRRFAE